MEFLQVAMPGVVLSLDTIVRDLYFFPRSLTGPDFFSSTHAWRGSAMASRNIPLPSHGEEVIRDSYDDDFPMAESYTSALARSMEMSVSFPHMNPGNPQILA